MQSKDGTGKNWMPFELNQMHGLVDSDGQAITGEAYGVDMLSDRADISRDLKTIRITRRIWRRMCW